MKKNGWDKGLVMQGYFRPTEEQNRGKEGVLLLDTRSRRAPSDPRREKIRGAVGQAKAAASSKLRPPPSKGSKRLPGMGAARIDSPRGVAQAQPGNKVTVSKVAAAKLRSAGRGRPLEPGIRRSMEHFFGVDFSTVRVHEGRTAQAMGALAFTLGEDVHFAPGLYDTTTRAGVELLGHELAHVIQQREDRVRNPHGRGIALVQDPGLEAEADDLGRRSANEIKLKSKQLRIATTTSPQRAPTESTMQAAGWQDKILEYTGPKKNQLLDAVSDPHRVNMQNTTKRIKGRVRWNTVKYEQVNLGKIKLLHGLDPADEKLLERIKKAKQSLGDKWKNQKRTLSLNKEWLSKILPSADSLKLATNNTIGRNNPSTSGYITLEGVGRVAAIQVACSKIGIPLDNVTIAAQVTNVSTQEIKELYKIHQHYYLENSVEKQKERADPTIPERVIGFSKWIRGLFG